MPTIDANQLTWANYAWSEQGDEWSHAWGGTEFLWWGSLFPRIQSFIPTGKILEIAPGFGRCTHYLKDFSRQLILVDLTERCIQACQQRFAAYSHLTYHVNDGKSLAMIPDRSIDFVFSFDSLVHAESDVLEAYLQQLAHKLKSDGVGFFHHSNMHAFVNTATGTLPFENTHWRAESMSAQLFEQYCTAAGLQCVNQEIINWGCDELIDCFSTFTLHTSSLARPNKIVQNNEFMREAAYFSFVSSMYHPSHFPGLQRADGSGSILPEQPVPTSQVPSAHSSLLRKALHTLHQAGARKLAIEVVRYLLWVLEGRPGAGK